MKVLITLTDVEPAVRLNARLEADGVETAVVSPLDDMRSSIEREQPDVIVVTGNLADEFTRALVREQQWRETAVVGLSDVADPRIEQELRASGYTTVYPKPVDPAELADAVRRLAERRQLQAMTGLAGESEAIREVMVQIEQMAPVSSTVLIEGESGTGKELVARAIHQLSARRGKPFIAVSVGALPETLLESELFGHEKGAFTGAAERRLGRFELATAGTLFLDEIGDIPPSTQVKLLRALEEREAMRVGGTQPYRVNVRVVAATNRPLRELVAEGSFRTDLYYRLNVLRIYLPPLRERREDITVLVRRFVRQFSAEHDKPFHGISQDAMQMLVDYSWPGNIRELRNLVESMVVLAPGREIRPEDLPRHIREGGSARFLPVHVGPVLRGGEGSQGREMEFIVRSLVELKLQVEELRRRLDQERDTRQEWPPAGDGELRSLGAGAGGSAGAGATAGGQPVQGIEPQDQEPPRPTITLGPGMTMAKIEREAIQAALRDTRGNRRKAAELLGIGERTLYRKLKEYQLLGAATS